MSEAQVSHERDLGRAEWQRSIGQVVFTQAADELFAPGPIWMPTSNNIEHWAAQSESGRGTDPFWYTLHEGLRTALEARSPFVEADSLQGYPAPFFAGLEEYTYYKDARRILQEGIHAQVSFSLNLAQLIGQVAEQRKVAGFELQNHAQISIMLRRPDYRGMVHAALQTRNGYWEHLSIAKGLSKNIWEEHEFAPATEDARKLAPGIQFKQGKVDFTSSLKRHLREELREVNKKGGVPNAVVESQPSSGCPVSHKRPHFSPTQESENVLKQFATLYNCTVEELMEPRQQTVVDDGLDFMATMIDNFDGYWQQGWRQYPPPTSTD